MFFKVFVELLDEQPGTAHTYSMALGYAAACTNQNRTHSITSGRELDETMSCQKKRYAMTGSSRELDDRDLNHPGSNTECCFDLPLMQVSAGRTSCC